MFQWIGQSAKLIKKQIMFHFTYLTLIQNFSFNVTVNEINGAFYQHFGHMRFSNSSLWSQELVLYIWHFIVQMETNCPLQLSRFSSRVRFTCSMLESPEKGLNSTSNPEKIQGMQDIIAHLVSCNRYASIPHLNSEDFALVKKWLLIKNYNLEHEYVKGSNTIHLHDQLI